jgi:hypothetical protein
MVTNEPVINESSLLAICARDYDSEELAGAVLAELSRRIIASGGPKGLLEAQLQAMLGTWLASRDTSLNRLRTAIADYLDDSPECPCLPQSGCFRARVVALQPSTAATLGAPSKDLVARLTDVSFAAESAVGTWDARLTMEAGIRAVLAYLCATHADGPRDAQNQKWPANLIDHLASVAWESHGDTGSWPQVVEAIRGEQRREASAILNALVDLAADAIPTPKECASYVDDGDDLWDIVGSVHETISERVGPAIVALRHRVEVLEAERRVAESVYTDEREERAMYQVRCADLEKELAAMKTRVDMEQRADWELP